VLRKRGEKRGKEREERGEKRKEEKSQLAALSTCVEEEP